MLASPHCVPSMYPARNAAFSGYHIIRVPEPSAGAHTVPDPPAVHRVPVELPVKSPPKTAAPLMFTRNRRRPFLLTANAESGVCAAAVTGAASAPQAIRVTRILFMGRKPGSGNGNRECLVRDVQRAGDGN